MMTESHDNDILDETRGQSPSRGYVLLNRPERRSGRMAQRRETKWSNTMATILWIIAAILVIAGVVALFRRQILWGVVLIIVGLLVGPGGVSLFA